MKQSLESLLPRLQDALNAACKAAEWVESGGVSLDSSTERVGLGDKITNPQGGVVTITKRVGVPFRMREDNYQDDSQIAHAFKVLLEGIEASFADAKSIRVVTRLPNMDGDCNVDSKSVTDPDSGISFEVSEYANSKYAYHFISIAYGVLAV